MKTLTIKIDWGLGRVIAMTWAITEVAKKRPVKVVTSRPLAFWGNPYIEWVYGLDDRRVYQDAIKGNDYLELEPYTDPDFFNEGKNWLDVAAKQLGLKTVPQPVLYLAEHEKIENVLEWNNPIIFQPFGSTMKMNWADKSYRSIRVEDAQYIANWLVQRGYNVYVARREDQPMLENTQTLTTPYLRWLVSLCDRYPVLWCDSSLHHAAKAFGKKAIVVWSWTDAGRFWYDTNVNLRYNDDYEYVPFRLGVDFDLDIINQRTNIYPKEFLDKILEEVDKNFINKSRCYSCKGIC